MDSGTPARAYKSEIGKVEIVDLGAFKPTPKEEEEHLGDSLTPIILRLVNKAEGYRWNTTGWKAWCRTCPAQEFSVQKFFGEAMWISHADGIEVRFYDDLENEIGIYRIDKGQCSCIFDKIHILE